MWCAIRRHLSDWADRCLYIRISTKITLMYAAILFFVLILSTTILGMGAYIFFYRQAEVDLDRSIRHVMNNIESGNAAEAKFWFEGPVIPGVIVRITDDAGRIVLDTDPHFPSNAAIEQGRVPTPFWANPEMELSEFRNGSVYHAQRTLEYGGVTYRIHFFRTITTEKDFFYSLQRLLFYTVAICFVLALIAGHFISRRILTPIRAITRTAGSIEVERLGQRLTRVVAALDVDRRTHLCDQCLCRILAEDHHRIDGGKCPNDLRAIQLIVDGARRSLEPPHRGVAVQPEDEHIPLRTCRCQVAHMPHMEDVKAAVGKDDARTCRTQRRRVCLDAFVRNEHERLLPL